LRKIIFPILLLVIVSYAQCLSAPISTRVGLKFGINPGTYDPDDNLDAMKGTGVHFGFGMGTDLLNLISLDIGAQFRTTKYSREETIGRITHSYKNLYFPIFFSLKAAMLPLVSPYIGAGLGINVQFDGVRRWEPNGVAVETELEGATNAYFILGLGAEIKFVKLRLCPEFTANIKPTSDEQADKYTDFHLSLGLYYAP